MLKQDDLLSFHDMNSSGRVVSSPLLELHMNRFQFPKPYKLYHCLDCNLPLHLAILFHY